MLVAGPVSISLNVEYCTLKDVLCCFGPAFDECPEWWCVPNRVVKIAAHIQVWKANLSNSALELVCLSKLSRMPVA